MSDDAFTCESCGSAIPVDAAIGMEDCWFCPTCYAEFRAEFDACTHDWEPHTDSYGDPGRYCKRCTGFVADDVFADLFPDSERSRWTDSLRVAMALEMATRRKDAVGRGAVMDVYGDLADAALAAIEASGTHVVVPLVPEVEQTNAGGDALLGNYPMADTVYRAMLAARPHDLAPTDKSDAG